MTSFDQLWTVITCFYQLLGPVTANMTNSKILARKWLPFATIVRLVIFFSSRNSFYQKFFITKNSFDKFIFYQNFFSTKFVFNQNYFETFNFGLVWYGFIGFNFDFHNLIAIAANMFELFLIQR